MGLLAILIGLLLLYSLTRGRGRQVRALLYMLLTIWIVLGRMLLAYYRLLFGAVGLLLLLAIFLVGLREKRAGPWIKP